MLALARLAIGGFAPSGRPPVAIVAIYAGGLTVTLLSGYLPPDSAAKAPPGPGSRPAAHHDAS